MKISLKGKLGENPTLSRNCKFGAHHNKPLWKREGMMSVDDKSGDLPYSSTHQIPAWK